MELLIALLGALASAYLASHAWSDHLREKRLHQMETRMREIEIKLGGDPIAVKIIK